MRPLTRLLLTLCAATACTPKYIPPAPAPERAPTLVGAPFAVTWDAVIDALVGENVPVQSVDKASGFVIAEREFVDTRTPEARSIARALADCGSGGQFGFFPPDSLSGSPAYVAASGVYNVIVRPMTDSTSSVKMTVRYRAPGAVCESRGTYEAALEAQIRTRAEGGR